MTQTKPMSSQRRAEVYSKQRKGGVLTFAQLRRWTKKSLRLKKKGIEK